MLGDENLVPVDVHVAQVERRPLRDELPCAGRGSGLQRENDDHGSGPARGGARAELRDEVRQLEDRACLAERCDGDLRATPEGDHDGAFAEDAVVVRPADPDSDQVCERHVHALDRAVCVLAPAQDELAAVEHEVAHRHRAVVPAPGDRVAQASVLPRAEVQRFARHHRAHHAVGAWPASPRVFRIGPP